MILLEIDSIRKAGIEMTDAAKNALKRGDKDASNALAKGMTELGDRRDRLAWQLYEADPKNTRLSALLGQRWMHRVVQGTPAPEVLEEIDRVLGESHDPAFVRDVAFLKAEAVMRINVQRRVPDLVKESLPSIDEATRVSPEDKRGGKLLFTLIQQGGTLPFETRNRLEERILRDYPASPYSEQVLKGRAVRAKIGQPFDLHFKDAITGVQVSTKDFRGKVIVVDFWASWCGPCIMSLPRLRQLYEAYHEKGVEFIGISLDRPEDEGGLDALKKSVAENRIPWPQYYQGGSGAGSFADANGVDGLPCIFVVDREGRLAFVQIDTAELEKHLLSLITPDSKAKSNP
ncbi:TlpA family protein disulfide reductase [Singulisphaera rosea]